jgi:hypothetical protein
MTERAMDGKARRYARAFLRMVRPALCHSERRDFREAAYRLCRSLIESCQRQAGRERIRIKPSLN